MSISASDEKNLNSASQIAIPVEKERKRSHTKPPETLSGLVRTKREMLLLQYSLSVKREEIRKLDDVVQVQCLLTFCLFIMTWSLFIAYIYSLNLCQAAETKLHKAEEYLATDLVRFEKFVKGYLEKCYNDAIPEQLSTNSVSYRTILRWYFVDIS